MAKSCGTGKRGRYTVTVDWRKFGATLCMAFTLGGMCGAVVSAIKNPAGFAWSATAFVLFLFSAVMGLRVFVLLDRLDENENSLEKVCEEHENSLEKVE